MRGLIRERFALIRVLRENRYCKTFVADDCLLNRQKVIVKVLKKEYVQGHCDHWIQYFSRQLGIEHSRFANVFDSGISTDQRLLYYVREYLPASELLFIDPLVAM